MQFRKSSRKRAQKRRRLSIPSKAKKPRRPLPIVVKGKKAVSRRKPHIPPKIAKVRAAKKAHSKAALKGWQTRKANEAKRRAIALKGWQTRKAAKKKAVKKPAVKPVKKPTRKAPPKAPPTKPIKPAAKPVKKPAPKQTTFEYLGDRTTQAGFHYYDYKVVGPLTKQALLDWIGSERREGKRGAMHATVKFKDRDGKTHYRSTTAKRLSADYADALLRAIRKLIASYDLVSFTVVLTSTFER